MTTCSSPLKLTLPAKLDCNVQGHAVQRLIDVQKRATVAGIAQSFDRASIFRLGSLAAHRSRRLFVHTTPCFFGPKDIMRTRDMHTQTTTALEGKMLACAEQFLPAIFGIRSRPIGAALGAIWVPSVVLAMS